MTLAGALALLLFGAPDPLSGASPAVSPAAFERAGVAPWSAEKSALLEQKTREAFTASFGCEGDLRTGKGLTATCSAFRSGALEAVQMHRHLLTWCEAAFLDQTRTTPSGNVTPPGACLDTALKYPLTDRIELLAPMLRDVSH